MKLSLTEGLSFKKLIKTATEKTILENEKSNFTILY